MTDEMLTGWKPIAGFCKISVQTAKKWHKKKGLPVLRGPHNVPISFVSLIREWAMAYDKIRKKIEDSEKDEK